MTEKERFFCVLHGEPTDRPPCICPGGMMNMITEEVMDRCGVSWPEAHTEAEQMAALALANYENGCFENVGVPFCMTAEAEAMGAGITLGTKVNEPRFRDEDLKYCIEQCAQMDESIKTGKISDSIAVELLITYFSLNR